MTEKKFADLTDHIKKLKMRLVASVVLFGTFLALAVADIYTTNHVIQYVVIGVFLVSFLLLPRQTFPYGVKSADISKDDVQILNKLRLNLSYTRVAYFIVSFLILGLPKIL